MASMSSIQSIEQSELPFGDETLGARLRGFDRDFLRALASLPHVTIRSCWARSSTATSPFCRRRGKGQPSVTSETFARSMCTTIATTLCGASRSTSWLMASRRRRWRWNSPPAPKSTPLFSADGSMMLAGRQVRGSSAQHDNAQFRRRFRRHSHVFIRRPRHLHGQGEPGVLSPGVQGQDRADRDVARRRGSQTDIEAFFDHPRNCAWRALHTVSVQGRCSPNFRYNCWSICACNCHQQLDSSRCTHELDRGWITAIAIVFAGFSSRCAAARTEWRLGSLRRWRSRLVSWGNGGIRSRAGPAAGRTRTGGGCSR